MTHPELVQPCCTQIETLMAGSNRNIATVCITTLFKTATDTNVDRVMKQLRGYMTDIADEFKVVVIEVFVPHNHKQQHSFSLCNPFDHSLTKKTKQKTKQNKTGNSVSLLEIQTKACHVCVFSCRCTSRRRSLQMFNC